MSFIPEMRIALFVAPIWFMILYIGYKIKKRDSTENTSKKEYVG
jgi:AAT family amino acid transporter